MVGTLEVEKTCDTAYARAAIFTLVENQSKDRGPALGRSRRKISSSEETAVSEQKLGKVTSSIIILIAFCYAPVIWHNIWDCN